MKKNLFISLCIILTQYSKAQVSLTLSGDKPLTFTSTGSGTYDQSAIYNNSSIFLIDLAKANNNINSTPIDFGIDARGGTHKFFTIKGISGNIGIGAVNPLSKLHVQNGETAFTWTPIGGTVGIFESSAVNRAFITIVAKSNAESELWFADESRQNSGRLRYEHNNDAFEFWTDGANRMTLNKLGQVGIGATTMGTHKLAVEGTIGAREIKVEAFPNWSDFVFEDDYKLRTLDQVEKYINEKGHLPEIPNAAEVAENGIYLGEMNAKLLQKIEELTLYLIEQNKELRSQQNQNQEQQELIEQLQKEVLSLKN